MANKKNFTPYEPMYTYLTHEETYAPFGIYQLKHRPDFFMCEAEMALYDIAGRTLSIESMYIGDPNYNVEDNTYNLSWANGRAKKITFAYSFSFDVATPPASPLDPPPPGEERMYVQLRRPTTTSKVARK